MSLVRKMLNLGEGFFRWNVISRFTTLSPVGMIINITYKCNARCIMCNIWKEKSKEEMSLMDWERVLKDPIFTKIKDLTISGGEAFVHKDYIKLVKLMVASMPKLKRLVLNTNGFAENVVENILEIYRYSKLKKIKLSVTVSIDGIGKDHDEIRRISGGFEKAINTLKKLKKLSKNKDFNLNVVSVLMNKNIDKNQVINDWFTKKGYNHGFQLIGFHDTYVNNLNEKNNLDFNDFGRNKILNFLKKMSENFRFESFYWNDMYEMYKNKRRRMTPCPFLMDNLVIDCLGDVYYCLSTKPIGNFMKENRSIKEIYYDPINIFNRNNLWDTECKYCNSGCDVTRSVAYNSKKYFIFKIKILFKTLFNK